MVYVGVDHAYGQTHRLAVLLNSLSHLQVSFPFAAEKSHVV